MVDAGCCFQADWNPDDCFPCRFGSCHAAWIAPWLIQLEVTHILYRLTVGSSPTQLDLEMLGCNLRKLEKWDCNSLIMIWRRGQLRRGKICLNLMASVLLKEVFAWQMSRTMCSIALCTGKSKKCEWARVGPGITLWMSSSEPNKKEVFGSIILLTLILAIGKC